MTPFGRARLIAATALSIGLLAANGCLATLEQSVDLLLGSQATENLLRLPYAAVFPLATLFWRLW